ncbi:DNA cytosine methyltransferase [Stenotrophomonas sp. Sa5BUN4]|uniref:Cytosine-specific methyltransferase n=1 Tax=Stenotrophomonas lacuserhaii TaxID=2760084 RepID=A0A8X8FRP3_9GAMM|nr:DNA cytosine methyltransferase [Stenotrophomonas pennii]MBD7954721.1 DNA cytosine methyltransferase [Stenotrophomonas pennii]
MYDNGPVALDLFCGSGAVSLGLKQAGFNVVGAVDYEVGACRTYRANHPAVRLIEKDIKKVDPNEFSDLIPEGLDLLVICAPCQPFSSQNRAKSSADKRAGLLDEAKKFITRYEPRIVFLENVPGLASTSIFGEFTEWLHREFGYQVGEPMRINAADSGVPQRRMRMILVATKGVVLRDALNIMLHPKVTVGDVIGDLPVPPIGRSEDLEDPLHFARRHSALNLERLKHIPLNGGGRSSLPARLRLACHKNAKSSAFSDTYGRMSLADVAPTLTTGCTDITRGRFAHPVQNRAITLREAARIQSFPDDYIFHGNANQIAMQIGNAVPPRMMFNIALSMMAALQPLSNSSVAIDAES